MVGADAFLCCLLSKVNNFAFTKSHIFRPETFCLDMWLAGFHENVAISALTTTRFGPMHFLMPTYQSKQLCF